VSGAGNEADEKWTFGLRVLPGQIPRARVRLTLTYKFHPRLTAGVEYNPLAREVGVIGNLLVLTETKRRPALMLGTSTDRIGTPSGQAFYFTLSKNLQRETGLPIAPYVGAAYGTYEHRLRPVGGVNVSLGRGFSTLLTYNGVHVHPIVNYARGRHVFSLVLVRGRHPGGSYSITF
jgi:hypothetical protein